MCSLSHTMAGLKCQQGLLLLLNIYAIKLRYEFVLLRCTFGATMRGFPGRWTFPFHDTHHSPPQ